MRDAGKFFKTLFFAAVAVATLILMAPRFAFAAAEKIVVFHGEGEGSDAIVKDLKGQLPKGLTVGDAKKFDGALTKAGHKGAMGKALDSTKTRDKLLEKVRKAGTNAKVDVIVIVRVKKNKKDRTVTILVVDPTTAALAREDEVTLKGTKKAADDSKPVVASVMPALEKFAPAPEVTPPPTKKDDKVATKDEDKKDDDKKKDGDGDDDDDDDDKKKDDDDKKDEPTGERKTGEVATAMVVIGAGVDLGVRLFDYNQPITENNREYKVWGAPMLALNLELYPLAGKGALGGLGLVGHYAQALALQSAPKDGEKFQTSWNRWLIGLRYRIAVGSGGAYVAPIVGYGGENFTFSGQEEPYKSQSPAARYTFIKLGVDGRIPLGPVGLMAGVGYRITSSPSGDDPELVSGRYPHMTVGGVDANLGVGIPVLKGLEARVLLHYTRFFYSMNPEVGDRYVAGGALDQLAGLHIGAAYVY